MSLGSSLRRYRGNETGIAALEFALVAPFLILLVFGGYELARYIVVQQKAEKMAYAISDLTSQYQTLTSSDVATVFSATSQLMKPYAFSNDGLAILTSVYKDPTKSKPTVSWQCKTSSTLSSTSTVGAVNGNATLPGGLVLDDKDNVIVSEIYYKFTPLFTTLWTSSFVIHRMAVYRPRLGSLTAVPGC